MPKKDNNKTFTDGIYFKPLKTISKPIEYYIIIFMKFGVSI